MIAISKSIKLGSLVFVSVLTLAACGGGSGAKKLTDQDKAIDKIAEYAESGKGVPSLKDYQNAGLSGVSASNLSQLNDIVKNLKRGDVDTKEELQAILENLGISIADTQKPVITLKGENPINLVKGSSYTEAGATAVDNVDGNIDVSVTGSVNTAKAGTYTITYTAKDSAKNVATISRTVNVAEASIEQDTTAPQITLLGSATVHLTVGDVYNDAGATANDNKDGNISDDIIIENLVDTSVAATYKVKYNVDDVAGNHATEVTRTVVVAEADVEVEPAKAYGKAGSHTVAAAWEEPEGKKSVVYYPADISTDHPTPVIFFAPGWGQTHDVKDEAANAAGFESLLKFIASKGYSVIFARDDKGGTSAEHFIKYFKTMAKHPDVAPYIDTSKIGVLGFSSGGGHAFNILKRLKKDEGWGENARFLFVMEPWFAFDMKKAEMETLPSNTNTVFVQFGEGGNNDDPKYHSQDPRIPLTEFYLLKSIADDKKDYQIVTEGTHSYPEGDRPYAQMQGILKPLDALMDLTFENPESASAHRIALEVGNDDPYANGHGIQELNAKKSYHYKCNDIIFDEIDYCSIGSKKRKYPPEVAFTSIATDRTPDMPALGASIVDPKFGTTVSRMTNRATQNGNNHQYPKTPSWNSDMTLLRLQYRLYNAETLQESPITSATATNSALYSLNGSLSEIKWSNTQPNVFYGISSAYDFIKATINGNQISTESLAHFPKADYDQFTLGKYEGNIDHNDRYVAFAARKKGKNFLTAIVLDIKNKTIVANKDFTDIHWVDANGHQILDWVSVSPSGTSVLINWKDKPQAQGNNASSIHQYDIHLNYIRKLADQGQHGDIGVDANGIDTYVQFEFGGSNGIWGYRLSDGKRTQLLPSKYNGGHVSCRNTQRPGWCYLSTTEEGRREVLAVKLDGSQKVNRFVQTRTSNSKNSQGGVSPDGMRIIFQSDWGVDGAEKETYHVK